MQGKDYGKYLGSFMMACFGVIAVYRWNQTGLIFFLLLVIRDFVAAYFFLKRKPSQTKSNRVQSLVAYASSMMPLIYFAPSEDVSKGLLMVSDLMSILGFLIVALATLELGTSIGISPANRGLVKSGVYKYIKHPMYTGYVVSEIGMVLVSPVNSIIFIVSGVLYFKRSSWESRIIIKSKYEDDSSVQRQT